MYLLAVIRLSLDLQLLHSARSPGHDTRNTQQPSSSKYGKKLKYYKKIITSNQNDQNDAFFTFSLHFQYQLITHLSIDGVQCPGIIAQIDHKYVVGEKDQLAPHIFRGSLCAIWWILLRNAPTTTSIRRKWSNICKSSPFQASRNIFQKPLKQPCPTFFGKRVSQKRQTKRINMKQMKKLSSVCIQSVLLEK